MPHPIESKLVVAVASSALFQLSESDKVFREKGLEAYRRYQRKNQDRAFEMGIAFPFIQRLLSINDAYPEDRPVEVVLLSKNDPDTGLRAFKSAHHYGLDITRGAFLNGQSPHRYIDAFNASLFLSADPKDVRAAIEARCPAGLVLGDPFPDDASDPELRVAFDFDGVIADDSSEAIFHKSGKLNDFHENERKNSAIPHSPGLLQKLFRGLAHLQTKVQKVTKTPAVRIALVTARNAPSHERVVTTLRQWGVRPDQTFFLGGIAKNRILETLRPHIFFDDQLDHLKGSSTFGAMVHVPFGVKNQV